MLDLHVAFHVIDHTILTCINVGPRTKAVQPAAKPNFDICHKQIISVQF